MIRKRQEWRKSLHHKPFKSTKGKEQISAQRLLQIASPRTIEPEDPQSAPEPKPKCELHTTHHKQQIALLNASTTLQYLFAKPVEQVPILSPLDLLSTFRFMRWYLTPFLYVMSEGRRYVAVGKFLFFTESTGQNYSDWSRGSFTPLELFL